MALWYPTPSSAPKPSLPSVPRLKTILNCLMIHGRVGKATWRETYINMGFPLFPWNAGSVSPFRTLVMLPVVTVSLNAAPSYSHIQSTRKYCDGLGKALKTGVRHISLDGW